MYLNFLITVVVSVEDVDNLIEKIGFKVSFAKAFV